MKRSDVIYGRRGRVYAIIRLDGLEANLDPGAGGWIDGRPYLVMFAHRADSRDVSAYARGLSRRDALSEYARAIGARAVAV